MKRFTTLFGALLLAPFLLSPVHTQVNSGLAGVIAQLLDYPAPPPPPPKELTEALAAMSSLHVDGDPPDPGEDAPIKILMAYWEKQVGIETGKLPSEKVRRRLLQACEEEPGFPINLLDFLSNMPEAHARLKQILDEERIAGSDPLDFSRQEYRRELREWLMCNSEYLRDELIRDASGARDDDDGVKSSRQLAALARLDWRTAEPLLKNYAGGAASLTAAFAFGLLYEHATQNNQSAESDAYRERLKRIAGDSQALGDARAMAVNAMMRTEWQGRDEWFLSLFADRSFVKMEDGSGSIDALAEPVKRDPDRWIPAISQLIGHGDRNVHSAAALCLAQFAIHRLRKDALLPLLPCLSDPQWAAGLDETDRSQLASRMGRLKMREALPGLSWIIRNEKASIRATAADALAEMRDSSVVPVLREMIQAAKKDDGDYSILSMTKALIACGGLTIEETVAALESCAAKSEVIVEERRGDRYLSINSTSGSFDVRVGNIIASNEEYASEALAAAVVERLKALRSQKPDIAAKLWLIAQQWRFPVVDVAIVELIVDGSANLDALLTACERRQDLRAHAAGALRELVDAGGYRAGVGAALRGDRSSALDILNGGDRPAKLALLACARVLREPLPVEKAGALLKSPDKLLALAAERYLESEDSMESRKLILTLHSNEALILGARDKSDPKSENEEKWIRWEDNLREDARKNRADEIFGLLHFSYSDVAPFATHHSAIIRMRQGKAELCKQDDPARDECRNLTDSELQSVREIYEEVSFDDLGPISLSWSGYGGSEGEFIKLDKSGGRRVYASNLYQLSNLLPYKTKKPHIQLYALFGQLCVTGEFELRYALKAKIKDLEVIAADDKHPVNHVCKQGDEFRALVREKDSEWTETNGERKWEEEVWRWRSIVNNKLGEIVDQPDACPILDTQEDMPEEMRKDRPGVETSLWKIRSGRYFVRDGEWKDREGLWLCAPGSEPKSVVEGKYSAPLVTPDGNYLVAVRDGALARIDIRKKQVMKLETDDFHYPVTLDPGSGKVYFSRSRGEQTEHVLLDAATGKIEVVKGNFEPLSHQNLRPLQPVAGSREYWVAIPDSEKNLTRVGRYDTRAFSFKPLMEIPEIRFASEAMWVDEAAKRIYLTYNGHLLRLPLAVDQKADGK